jgi:hypothetical protein
MDAGAGGQQSDHPYRAALQLNLTCMFFLGIMTSKDSATSGSLSV